MMLRRLDVKALGLSFGLTWAGGIFLLGFAGSFGYGVNFIESLSQIYVGYNATLYGSFIGALWAFVDAFLGGAIMAWLYNKFAFCN